MSIHQIDPATPMNPSGAPPAPRAVIETSTEKSATEKSAGKDIEAHTEIPADLGDVTVAICAYTMLRWADIRLAVGSVRGQLRPGDECLLVIDHNDELHHQAVAEFTDDPQLRVVTSTGPRGLSGARNTAIDHSHGDVIAFLDDDAVAEPGWLDRVRTELSRPGVFAVGTNVRPHWPAGGRPRWFPPEFDWVVGCSYLGMPSEPADVRNAIGAAMAFRREAFTLAGRFSTAVGRVGRKPTGCEETELCIRLRAARPGVRVRYLPGVSVDHHVTEDRPRLRYFLSRCLAEGRSKARVARMVGAMDGLSNERAYVGSVLPRGVWRELRRALRGELVGFAAAGAIVAGVLVTASGYGIGRLRREGADGHG